VRPDYDAAADGLDRDTLLEAAEVQAELLTWRRSEQEWASVAGMVDRLAAAVTAGDRRAARLALLSLAQLSAMRTGRIGDPGQAAPPETVVEKATLLQYALRRAGSAPAPASASRLPEDGPAGRDPV
jgi:hypothetical protein